MAKLKAFRIIIATTLLFSSGTQAKSLWSTKPAIPSDILRTAYPIGNGKLAALPFGEPGREILNINRDSLWSGGPFENTSYSGGNSGPRYQYLQGIRDWIWQNGTGNVSELMGDNLNYGSYAVLGNLTVTIGGVQNVSSYKRTLDLETAVHTTTYIAGDVEFTTLTYCSYPDDVCVYELTASAPLPDITVYVNNALANASLVSTSCSDGEIVFRGITQAGIGMLYQASVGIVENSSQMQCNNGSLTIRKAEHKSLSLVLAAGTNFDQSKGTAESEYSFRGEDPNQYVGETVRAASKKSATDLLNAHVADYNELFSAFLLNLPDTKGSAKRETEVLVAQYATNITGGDPYLESLTFDFARYLFISSSRNGSLPPNLQGKWANGLYNAWSGDYHANINLQMNHWHVDQTGLGPLEAPLWEYMAQNWAPRGAESARLIYNASGWVVHNEMNIFGHTGMKGDGDISSEIWANYPISAAWMMQHVWDYFDYSQDVEWLRSTGYPMLKAISEFWLSQLQEDQYFKDATLVVNPCTSAEHGPTTFACTHHQQLIHQLFVTTLQSAEILSADASLITTLRNALSHLDIGLHIGSWNQIQEWKLDIDAQNDTHRHLSHLVGWHPGFSISSYADGYINTTIQSAVRTSLTSRGVGITDANSGWEKVWRSAAWARLNDTEQAYYELRLTIEQNWAPNLFSMYSGKNLPFQIDANFGFAGAVLSMLVVDLPMDLVKEGEVRTVVLGPAIPAAWGGGSVKGLRIRGGGKGEFEWDGNGVVTRASLEGGGNVRLVNVKGDVLL